MQSLDLRSSVKTTECAGTTDFNLAIVLHGCAAIIMTIITPIIMHDNRLDNTLLYDYYHDYYHA